MSLKNTLLLVILMPFILFFSCTKTEPEDVARSFAEAVSKRNYEEAKKYADSETAGLIDLLKKFGSNDAQKVKEKSKKSKVTKVDCEEVKDEKTTCECVIEVDGNTKTETLQLKKVDGEWKVHMTKDSE